MRHHVLAGASSLLLTLAVNLGAFAYIDFPPMTLKKMCEISHHVQLLTVEKSSQENGVIIFRMTESLKGRNSRITSFKHAIPPGHSDSKPVLEWMGEEKSAVMFFIEATSGTEALGYVFIDQSCYSVIYNVRENLWRFIRAEPNMSACYHGSVEQLQKLVKDSLAGKKFEVPVKKPETKEDADKRRKEVNEILKRNRKN